MLLPKDILEDSPSRRDGISEEMECDYRRLCCELVQEGGILLKLPQVVMVTGQTLAHRFYYRKSIKEFDVLDVAMGSLFLAAKVEERSGVHLIREVMRVFNYMYNERIGEPQRLLILGGERYSDWKQRLLRTERYILKELGFNVYSIMEHPHKFILSYVFTLFGSSNMGKFIAQKSWNYLNDSLRLDLCVRYDAPVIACAAIYKAAQMLDVPLPENPPWWTLFTATKEDIAAICRQLEMLYAAKKIVWLDPLSGKKKSQISRAELASRVAKPKIVLKAGLNVFVKKATAIPSLEEVTDKGCVNEEIEERVRAENDGKTEGASSTKTDAAPRESAGVSSENIAAAVEAARRAAAALRNDDERPLQDDDDENGGRYRRRRSRRDRHRSSRDRDRRRERSRQGSHRRRRSDRSRSRSRDRRR